MIHYILGCYPNYKSSAAYNRVRLIAEGLEKNGVNVKINLLLFRNRKYRIVNSIDRYLFSYFRHAFLLLHLLSKVDKKDVVIIYSVVDQYWILRLLSKRTNLIVEYTEYPYYEINCERNNLFKKFIQTYYNKQNLNYLKYVSCVITCSSYLKKYYLRYASELYLLPLVVDLDEFIKKNTNSLNEIGEYIAYCGSFNNNKDGLPILIDSFEIFHKTHPNVKLVLIGSGNKDVNNKFKRMVHNKDLDDSVLFTGSMPHEKVRKWLLGATILALARPNSRQAEGGVPSKVGEYLASGIPCVITKTGDLPKYLHDGVDCFLCEPDSVVAFAQRLEDCYKSDRSEVGRRAIETAQQFGNINQTKLLIDYLVERFGIEIIK